MKLSEFQTAVDEEFGPGYGSVVVNDLVLAGRRRAHRPRGARRRRAAARRVARALRGDGCAARRAGTASAVASPAAAARPADASEDAFDTRARLRTFVRMLG